MTTMRDRRDEISHLLRRGDPYQGQELSGAERQRIRARMREVAGPPFLGLTTMRAGLAVMGVLSTLWLASWLQLPTAPEVEPVPDVAVLVPSAVDNDPRPLTAAVADPQNAAPTATSRLAAPGTAAPGTAAPGTAAPGTAAPGTAAPGTAAPGTAARRSVRSAVPASHNATLTVAAPALPPVLDEIPPRPARALRFTAPQGTRIIWTLDPDFEPTETRR